MAPSVDEGGRGVKESLIRPNAFGYVLDIGAGESSPSMWLTCTIVYDAHVPDP
jgi:hypothetical protein